MAMHEDLDLLGSVNEQEEAGYLDLARNFPYRPTLFLGLGGTGTQAVAKIKELFLKLYGPRAAEGFDGSRPTIPPMYAFLGFDTNITERPAILPEGKEWKHIGVDNLPAFYKGHGKTPFFRDWILKEYANTQLTAGAGGLRNLGRLALLSNFDQVRDMIDKARQTILMQHLHLRNTTPAIYVFCSLSGGTGSGALLDTCFLVRHLFGDKAEISGFIGVLDGLPTLHPLSRRMARVNTFGALKELNAFMTGKAEGQPCDETIKYPLGVDCTIGPPLNLCYLISPYKSDGSVSLRTQGHVSSFMARMAFMTSAFTFRGKNEETVASSPDYAGTIINNRVFLAEKVSGADVCYLVPGMAQIHFPMNTVANIFALEAAKKYLKHQASGNASDGDKAARDFAQVNAMDSRSLLDRLRMDPQSKGKRVLAAVLYDDLVDPLFEKRYENREQILAFGAAMPQKRLADIRNRLSENVEALEHGFWTGMHAKAAELMVEPGSMLIGAIDFLEDLRDLLAEQFERMALEAQKKIDPMMVEIEQQWRELYGSMDNVCTDDGILDRSVDNFKIGKAAAMYVSFLNEAEVVVLDKALNDLCHVLLQKLIDRLGAQTRSLRRLLSPDVPQALSLLEARRLKLVNRLESESEGRDPGVEDICSFNVISQSWREKTFAQSELSDPASVLSTLIKRGWHPMRLLDMVPPEGCGIGQAIAQEVLEQIAPLTQKYRTMKIVDVIGSAGAYADSAPEGIIARLYDQMLQPQMELKNMKALLGVPLNNLMFCGGIDGELKKKLEASPRLRGADLNVSDNLEDGRLNFFTVTLPVAMAGCDLLRDVFEREYDKWRGEVAQAPTKEQEAQIARYHCYKGSYHWPSPLNYRMTVEAEKELFAQALAISEILEVSDDDQRRMAALGANPTGKAYGIFQVGRSQFWLMPFFEPNAGGSISGKPIRLGANVCEAYQNFVARDNYREIANRWVQWFVDHCYDFYNTAGLESRIRQAMNTLETRKGKTRNPEQSDLYDQLKAVMEAWNPG